MSVQLFFSMNIKYIYYRIAGGHMVKCPLRDLQGLLDVSSWDSNHVIPEKEFKACFSDLCPTCRGHCLLLHNFQQTSKQFSFRPSVSGYDASTTSVIPVLSVPQKYRYFAGYYKRGNPSVLF